MAIERVTPNNVAEWRAMGLHHLQRYEFAARFTEGKAVLDVACGNGYGSFALKNLGAQSVKGVDLDPKAIEYAESHYSAPGVVFECMDCLEVPAIPCGYETVVTFETIEHLDKPDRFVRKLHELISPNGRLILSAPNTLRYQRADNPIDNPYHRNEPTYEDLKAWLAPSFIVDQEWEQSPVSMGFSRQSALVSTSTMVRWLLNLDRAVKSLVGSRSLDSAERGVSLQESHLQVTTQMFPLLPERRSIADVFVFVCHPRP
jgi:2-polyprenyl-3-methyl-5-hydroxy-6-metoxy-1,4-benzoquinol methylase